MPDVRRKFEVEALEIRGGSPQVLEALIARGLGPVVELPVTTLPMLLGRRWRVMMRHLPAPCTIAAFT